MTSLRKAYIFLQCLSYLKLLAYLFNEAFRVSESWILQTDLLHSIWKSEDDLS